MNFAFNSTAQIFLEKKIGCKRREAAKVLALTASRGVSSKWLVIIIDALPPKRFPFSQLKFRGHRFNFKLIQNYYTPPIASYKSRFFWNFPARPAENRSVEQIFAPALVAMPDQPHELP